MANTQIDMSLLDKSIDDIEDLAGFAVPVNGMYSLKFSTKVKVVNGASCVESNFEVIECLRANDPDDAATPVGTKFSVLTHLENPIAMSKFKEMITPVSVHFSEGRLLKLVTEVCAEEMVITAKVTRRRDKDDKEKFYANVSEVTVA